MAASTLRKNSTKNTPKWTRRFLTNWPN